MSSLPAGQVGRSDPDGGSRLNTASIVRAEGRPLGATSGAVSGRDIRETLSIYLALTKPRIIQLLLVTTVPSMVIAADGWPGTWLVVATLIGGTLSAASANTINNYLDRDIDRIMHRTRQRPLARGAISPGAALRFGVALGVAGFVWLAVFTNLLAALLATSAILFYVFVYTLGLKRRTNQAVVIGGAAGCVPVLAGWAAVTGTIQPVAWALFAIIFYWTPPHFWALAMKFRDDYARAGVPMLPVVATPVQVSKQIVTYSWVMVVWTMLLVPATGWVYTGFAVLTGTWFLIVAHRLHAAVRRGEPGRPMKLFHMSNTYLMLTFVALAVDSALGLPVFGLPF